MGAVQPYGWIQSVFPFAVLAVVLALRWRRMGQDRPLRLERLWILPAIHLVVAAALFASQPPPVRVWLFCGTAAILGAAIGWQRGRMMRISVDPVIHRLNHRGSPAALLIILALVVVRQGLRVPAVDRVLGLDPAAVTDIAISLVLGLFTALRLEMYLRGRRLLALATGA